jgi:SET family sugar efflux transporter-like MFS transporter
MVSSLALVARTPSLRAMTATLFLTGFTYAATLPYLSVVAVHELGMSNSMLSLALFLFALANLTAGVSMALISDIRRDYRRLQMIACSAGIVGYGVIFAFPSKLVFLLAGVTLVPLCNSSYALIFSAIRAQSNSLAPAEASNIGTSVRAIYSGSWVLIPGLVGLALAGSGSMLPAWGFAALSCVVSLAVTTIFMPRGAIVSTAPAGPGFLGSLKDILEPQLLARVVAMAAVTGAQRLASVVGPLLLIGHAGGRPTDVGFIAGGVALLEIPFMLLWGGLLKRYTTIGVMAAGSAIFAAFLVAQGAASAPWQFYLLIIPQACGAAAIISMPMAYFQNMLSDRPGLGASLNQMTGFLAVGFSAATFALGAGLFGYGGAAWMGAGLAALGVIALIVLGRRDARA